MLALLLGGAVAAAAYLLLVFSRVDSHGALFYLPSVPFNLLTIHLAGFMYGGGMLTQFNIVRVLQSALLLVALTVAAVLGRPDVTVVSDRGRSAERGARRGCGAHARSLRAVPRVDD